MNNDLILALKEAKQKDSYVALPDDFLCKLIFSSISFDDSNLKESDVEKVLKGEFTGVSADKVLKIINQKNALNKVLSMVENKEPLNENALKDIHQILCEGTNVIGGLYRNVNISVKGSNHTPCSHEKVYDRMDKYFRFIEDGAKGDLFEYISYIHLQLLKIHPFLDCNGRLSRLVLNYELLSNGYAPVLFLQDVRSDYFKTVEAFKVEKEIVPFVDFLMKEELKSLNIL
jgi:Fic family protein